MQDDRNQDQITRKDARNCFVESLRDCFSFGRIHFTFASYDLSRPAGQRQTSQVQIYIPVGEFLNLCRKLECGELRYLLQSRKQSNDKRPLYETLGGTSAEKLARQGRPRPDGRSLSRTMQILCGSKSDLLLVAETKVNYQAWLSTWYAASGTVGAANPNWQAWKDQPSAPYPLDDSTHARLAVAPQTSAALAQPPSDRYIYTTDPMF